MENQPARARLFTAGAVLIVLVFLSHHFLFFFRDNFSTHFPVKAVSAPIYRSGQIPFWNFHAGGGQPLAGNPNTLTFYPDNILYLFLPAHAAFNLHFILHLAFGFYFLRDLLRNRGIARGPSTLAALIYLCSGVAMSSVAFYNLVTGVMLLPMAFGAIERLLSYRRTADAAVLGLSFGLAGLAGEPLLVLSVAAGCALLTLGRWSKAFALRLALSVAISVVIALPLLIAYSEISAEVERGHQKFSPEAVLAASLRPERFLEMVLGPFLGALTDQGPSGYLAHYSGRYSGRYSGQWPPLFATVFIGALLLPAIFSRGRTGWRDKVILVFFAFLALGRFNPIVALAVESFPSVRLLRYPEKFLLPMNAAAAILIGCFLADSAARKDRFVRMASGVGLIFCIGAALRFASLPADFVRLAFGSTAACALLLAVFGAVDVVSSRRWILLLATVPLVLSSPVWGMVDRKEFYLNPSTLVAAVGKERVWYGVDELELIRPDSARGEYRLRAFAAGPIFGAVHGLQYAGDRSPEGMYSFFSRIIHERLAAVPEALKKHYLDILGVRYILSSTPVHDSSWSARGAFELEQNRVFVYQRAEAAPIARAATVIVPVRSIQDAVARIEAGLDPGTAVVSAAARPPIDADLRIISSSIDGQAVRIQVEAGAPGLIILNQTYFSAWVATSSGDELQTLPVNIDRLGLIAPAGTSAIDLHFGRRRRETGIAVVFSVLASLVCASCLFRSRTRVADPAR